MNSATAGYGVIEVCEADLGTVLQVDCLQHFQQIMVVTDHEMPPVRMVIDTIEEEAGTPTAIMGQGEVPNSEMVGRWKLDFHKPSANGLIGHIAEMS